MGKPKVPIPFLDFRAVSARFFHDVHKQLILGRLRPVQHWHGLKFLSSGWQADNSAICAICEKSGRTDPLCVHQLACLYQ